MHSLRLTLFMLVSLAGHAAILVPLSGYLAALFDAAEVESDTVIVSISVISNTVTPEPESIRVDRPLPESPPLARQSSPEPEQSDPIGSEQKSLKTAAAPSPPEEPAAAEHEAQGSVAGPESGAQPQQNVVASSAESMESVARRRRMLQAEEKYLAELLNEISRHRVYPSSARKRGYQGGVEVDLTILRNGEFESIEISKPSDYKVLNRASTRAVSRLKRFKPFPSDIDRESWHISIPFRYVLTARRGDNS